MREESEREALVGAVVAAARADGSARDALDQAIADRLGINLTDLRCLDVLDQRGTIAAGELAAALGLTTGAVTTMLDRLERGGYVRRLRDAVDRRRVLVEPTEHVQRLAQELYGPLAEEGFALLRSYETRDLELIRHFFERSRDLQLRNEQRIRSSRPAGARARRAR